MGTDAVTPGSVQGRVPGEEWGLLSPGAARPPPRPPPAGLFAVPGCLPSGVWVAPGARLRAGDVLRRVLALRPNGCGAVSHPSLGQPVSARQASVPFGGCQPAWVPLTALAERGAPTGATCPQHQSTARRCWPRPEPGPGSGCGKGCSGAGTWGACLPSCHASSSGWLVSRCPLAGGSTWGAASCPCVGVTGGGSPVWSQSTGRLGPSAGSGRRGQVCPAWDRPKPAVTHEHQWGWAAPRSCCRRGRESQMTGRG